MVVCAAAVTGIVAFGPLAADAGTEDAVGRQRTLLGRSVDGSAITVLESGDFDSPRKMLIVGCIHGNECAGIAIAARLAAVPAPPETDLWILADLNPDGAAAHTRGNAHGVDLNRNFPWHWMRLTGMYASGPGPLSEPESRIAVRLMKFVRPTVSIWFHQHLNVVDDSSGNLQLERRFATTADMRLERLTREPGSVVTWESHCLSRGSAFVVELPSGSLSTRAAGRFTNAVASTALAAPESRPRLADCR